MSLVHELADRVGPRPAGSPAGAVAAETVAEALRAAGLEPRFQEFPLLAYEADETGREVGRIYANPVVGGPIPFLSLQHLPITVGPTVYVSVADGERLRGLE